MLQGSFNIRGLTAESGVPWVFRSAALDDATEEDFQKLSDFGVTEVIDLRSRGERGEIRHPFTQTVLPLYGEENLPPESGDLEEIYRKILRTSGTSIVDAANRIAHNPGVTLVHCRVGKDRTGLVIALVALAAGIPEDIVFEDYALSQEEVRKNLQAEVTERISKLALTDAERTRALELHLDSPVTALTNTLIWIGAEYGGVTKYLLTHGLSEDSLQLLRHRVFDLSAGSQPVDEESDTTTTAESLTEEVRRS